MNLVLQSFGNEIEYKRALLLVYSFLAHSTGANSSRIILFTDAPDYFKVRLSAFRIEYVLLTLDRIKKMRGDIDFVHRMKIAVIEEAFRITGDNIFYVDSDTFFIGDPTPTFDQLSPSLSFMHQYEYKFESLKDMALPAGETFRAFHHLISHQDFYLSEGNKLKSLTDHASWNAGAMALHFSTRQYLDDVYKLTDEFYRATANHASEQYAFSIVLQNKTQLQSCDAVVHHYWYSLKKRLIDDWIEKNRVDEWFKKIDEEKIHQLKEWSRMLPGYLEQHPLTTKDKSIQAFHRNEFKDGFRYAWQAMTQKQRDLKFVGDILYHTKRMIKIKLGF